MALLLGAPVTPAAIVAGKFLGQWLALLTIPALALAMTATLGFAVPLDAGRLAGAALWVVNASLILLGAAFGIACWRFGGLAEERLGAKDPRQVVADETAGQCVALLFLPWRAMSESGAWTWNTTAAAT